jgi:hypothetical protein
MEEQKEATDKKKRKFSLFGEQLGLKKGFVHLHGKS